MKKLPSNVLFIVDIFETSTNIRKKRANLRRSKKFTNYLRTKGDEELQTNNVLSSKEFNMEIINTFLNNKNSKVPLKRKEVRRTNNHDKFRKKF